MNEIIQFYLESKKIRFFVGLLLDAIITSYLIQAYNINIIVYFPYGVMFLYFIMRIINRENDFWYIKTLCYIAVGVCTLQAASEATIAKSGESIIVAVVAFIEAFDILFERWLKSEVDKFTPKINNFFKVLSVAVFGYNFK